MLHAHPGGCRRFPAGILPRRQGGIQGLVQRPGGDGPGEGDLQDGGADDAEGGAQGGAGAPQGPGQDILDPVEEIEEADELTQMYRNAIGL